MVSHHPSKFGGHRYCGIGDMFLLVEKQDSTSSWLNPPLKHMACNHTKYFAKSDIGHTCLKQK